ncbi:hypothetical protein DET48_10945 [Vibrio diazotrophicus]|jgi:hypothetical protein|uniref:Uncharacterized protein n=2 Tax=Gammaproteobacteria TaxID=1236 RepID=A0A329E9S0_VIBDI|nr:hypothetical protein DET48_10945 [Vibrio diazotrophicus]
MLGGSGKQLSINHSNRTLKQIAELNNLSNVSISFDNNPFKKIV